MSINAFDAAVAGESVLVTETRMEDLQLLGRVGGTSFVISGTRRNFSPESLNPYELLGAALGSSTAMTLRLYADRVGLPLVRVQVERVPSSERRGLRSGLRAQHHLGGRLERRAKACAAHVARHCPVDQTLSQGAEIHTSVSTDMHSPRPPRPPITSGTSTKESPLCGRASHTD